MASAARHTKPWVLRVPPGTRHTLRELPQATTMHERSLVKSLLLQVEQIMRDQAACRVVGVKVRIGEFSGVEPDLFQMAFEEMVASTPLRGADLAVTRLPLIARCAQCEDEFTVARFHFQCPTCGSQCVRITQGEELELESVVFERADR